MTRVIVVSSDFSNLHIILPAADALRHGELVAFPTETVYGLGANALDSAAVAKIFIAKGRPATDPLIVHLNNAQQVSKIARLEDPLLAEQVQMLASNFWPGPLTLVLPKQPTIPSNVTAGRDTVGVRVPAHPIAQALLRYARVPVAAPSANRFSHPSPTQALHVYTDLGERIEWLIDGGPTFIGIESTVLDMTQSPPTVLRPGGVTIEALRQIIPSITYTPRVIQDDEAAAGPGMSLKHYAPKTPLYLIEGKDEEVIKLIKREIAQRVGQRIGILAPDSIASILDDPTLFILALGNTPESIAARLYTAIRDLDAAALDVIFALHIKGEGVLIAIRDRLFRAAEGKIITSH